MTGVASLQGPQVGTTTFTISRAAFGINGNRIPAFFNWITQVGFETEGVALVVLAGLALATKAGFTPGTPSTWSTGSYGAGATTAASCSAVPVREATVAAGPRSTGVRWSRSGWA